MFVELLEDCATQLDLFEEMAFEQISGIEDEAFTNPGDLASAHETTHANENTSAVDLAESLFAALHIKAFAELD